MITLVALDGGAEEAAWSVAGDSGGGADPVVQATDQAASSAFKSSDKDDTRAIPGGASGPRVRVTSPAVMAEVQVFGA